jgi:hypothetical protein
LDEIRLESGEAQFQRVDQLELEFRSSCLGEDYGDRFTVDPADLTLAAVNEPGLWCVRKYRPSLKRTKDEKNFEKKVKRLEFAGKEVVEKIAGVRRSLRDHRPLRGLALQRPTV